MGTRVQAAGPAAAGTTFHRDGSSYQLTAGGNQLFWLACTPCHTTGWLANGVTSGVSLIRYTFQVVSSISPL